MAPEKKCIKCGRPIEAYMFEHFAKLRKKVVARRGETWANSEPVSKGPKVCASCLWKMLESCGEGEDR